MNLKYFWHDFCGIIIFTGFLIFLIFCISICFQPSAEENQQMQQYIHYIKEREVAKICNDGTRIYSWDNAYYISGSRYPDQKVSGPDICK